MYPGTDKNTNYFTFHLIGYMYKYNLVDPNKYTLISTSKVKPKTETMIERKIWAYGDSTRVRVSEANAPKTPNPPLMPID